MKSKILIWDLSVRILHWGLATCVACALAFGFLADDDGPLFRLHMLFGIGAVFLIGIRLASGVAGSRYARFSSYPLNPVELAGYLKSALVGKTRRYAGNNPGSAWCALAMFALGIALFVTGSSVFGGFSEDLHESFAWAMLVAVAAHLAGIVWHTIRHRENIAASMVSGKKQHIEGEGIDSAHPRMALGVFMLAGAWLFSLFSGQTKGGIRLPWTGITLHAGENEGEETHEKASNREHSKKHDGREQGRKRHRDDDD